jgi:S-adenosylmethionine-diacylglycerol 3-amino-3-carboxypropyl transferase
MNGNGDIRGDRIESRADFDFVRYANCWEDADTLIDAIQPRPGQRLLSIASAGDNSLALLATGAAVVAADLSTAQLACLELRCAAFRHLEHQELLAFLGACASDQRWKTYQRLMHDLSDSARDFWSRRQREVATGIIHMGKFERYFRTFRTRVLPLIHSRATIARMLEPKNETERREFWEGTWNNRRWRFLLRVFFSRSVMARMGRDPEFFRYVDGSIADQIRSRAQHAMVQLAPHQNPFLQYIATGNFQSALPRYLRAEHHAAIRDGLDRLTLFHGPIEDAATMYGADGFDGFNLSDIFEYISEKTTRELYGALLKHANAGAKLAYWNTFVPRDCPREFASHVHPRTERSAELFLRDKAFFYSRFHVDQVLRRLTASSSPMGFDSHGAKASVHDDALTALKSLGESRDSDDRGDTQLSGDDG